MVNWRDQFETDALLGRPEVGRFGRPDLARSVDVFGFFLPTAGCSRCFVASFFLAGSSLQAQSRATDATRVVQADQPTTPATAHNHCRSITVLSRDITSALPSDPAFWEEGHGVSVHECLF